MAGGEFGGIGADFAPVAHAIRMSKDAIAIVAPDTRCAIAVLIIFPVIVPVIRSNFYHGSYRCAMAVLIMFPVIVPVIRSNFYHRWNGTPTV